MHEFQVHAPMANSMLPCLKAKEQVLLPNANMQNQDERKLLWKRFHTLCGDQARGQQRLYCSDEVDLFLRVFKAASWDLSLFQALVGKTGTSVDSHLADLVNLPLRSGHADYFHCYDLSGGNILSHRGKEAKDLNSSGSSTGSNSSMEDGVPSFMRDWTRRIRKQRKMLQRGQGREFLRLAFRRHKIKAKPRIQAPGNTRYVVYCGSYLKQSLRHFAVTWPANI